MKLVAPGKGDNRDRESSRASTPSIDGGSGRQKTSTGSNDSGIVILIWIEGLLEIHPRYQKLIYYNEGDVQFFITRVM